MSGNIMNGSVKPTTVMAEGKTDEPQLKLRARLQNPFIHRLHFSTLDKIQIAIMSVFVCPIRLLLIVFMLFMAFVFASIALCGLDRHVKQQEPLSFWRNLCRPISVFFCRTMYFVGGYHWITIRGERASSSVAPILVTAPHGTFFDSFVIAYLGLTSVVVKSGTEDIPLIGKITQFTQPIMVHREDPESRTNTIKEIQRRAGTGGTWPQIIIFAEGTCTNHKSLINFKQGAFIPGVAVQPLCIKYKNKMNTAVWTWNGPAAFKILWLTIAQFSTQLELEYLPVYTPSEEEKKNPLLFANNVRNIMAKALDLPTSEYTYEDGLAMMHSLALPVSEELTYINRLVRSLNVTVDDIEAMLPGLTRDAQLVDSGQEHGEGSINSLTHVNIDQFATRLNCPTDSSNLKELYCFYLQRESVGMDMRPFIVHLYMLCRTYTILDTIKFAFQVFDQGTKGFLTKVEFVKLLRTFGLDEVKFSLGDKISCDDFTAFVKSQSEYTSWFKQKSFKVRADQSSLAVEKNDKANLKY